MTEEELANIDRTGASWDLFGSHGFFLDVTLSYPTALHESLDSFPLNASKEVVTMDQLSPYTLDILRNVEKRKTYSESKLVGTFNTKRSVLHCALLATYLRLGLRIEELHGGYTFKQADWCRPYIDFCMDKRRNAPSKFKRNVWKLAGNSIYGVFRFFLRKPCWMMNLM